MIPFKLVQKLYEAGFPYAWITWEGRLWPDPDNQPDLESLIKACALLSQDGDDFHLELNKGQWQASVCFNIQRYWENWYTGNSPREAASNLWLALPKKDQPRRAELIDVPTNEPT